jgi:hypothetical protein
MDAPTYPPAVAYAAPRVAGYKLSLAGCPIGELVANPAAWAIVLKHNPGFGMMVGSAQIKPHLMNMTTADLAVFAGGMSAATVATIDVELAQLPAVESHVL